MKHWLRFSLVAGGCALTLLAEDFWLKKPYTEWADKDAARMLQNSPWAHQVTISLGGPAVPNEGGRGGGRQRGGGGMGEATPGAMDTPNMNGPNSRGSGGRGGGGEMEPAGTPSIQVTVRWQSALPVRQAMV